MFKHKLGGEKHEYTDLIILESRIYILRAVVQVLTKISDKINYGKNAFPVYFQGRRN